MRICVGVAGALLVWALASLLAPHALVPPAALAARIVTLAADPVFQAAVRTTVLIWVQAVLLTAALAVPAGLVLGSVPVARTALTVLVEVARPVPAVAVIPLSLVTFGAGPPAEFVLAVFAGLWPVLTSVLAAPRDIDPLWLDTARAFDLTPAQITWRVRLPAILPTVLTGLRVAAALQLIVVVTTEYVAGLSENGLGAYVAVAGEQTGDTTTVLAGALVAGALGASMSQLLAALRPRWPHHQAATPPPSPPSTRRATVLRVVGRGMALAVWIGLWQVTAGLTRSPFAPTPAVIARAAYTMWLTGPARQLWLTPALTDPLGISLTRLALGWGLAVVAGVAGGVLLGSISWLADVVEPLAGAARAIPPVLLLPVLLLVVHVGTALSVVLIAVGGVWPILLHTMDGVRAVHHTLLDTARVYRTRHWRLVWAVIVPAAAPTILIGLRISLSLALILTIVSELIGASDGLGYQLAQTQATFAYPQMWAWIVLTGGIGYTLNQLLSTLAPRAGHHGLAT